MEIKFCRRCGAPLTQVNDTMFKCDNGHTVFYDQSPAASAIVVTADGRLAAGIRARNPHKGKMSLFGGYCDLDTAEVGLARELSEEAGLTTSDYEKPEFIMTDTDPYEWEGNVTQVFTVYFLVRLKPGVKLTPGDDVADIAYFDQDTFPVDELAFPSNRRAARVALNMLQTSK